MPAKNPVSRRFPAEWEPQSAVQLTFPHADSDWGPLLNTVLPCFVEIAETISRFQPVLIVCHDPEVIKPLLKNAQPANLHFAIADSNDTWSRDHGAITVEEDGRPLLLDFVFNGWGLKFAASKDNAITRTLYNSGVFQAPIHHGGLVLEGGGVESDGQGTLLSTTECMLSPHRNPHLNKARLEKELQHLFGTDRFLWLENGYLAGDDTDSHIDTLARFCNPTTITYVRCPDPADEHFEALRLMEAELQRFRTRSGDPYQLIPLPWPDACYDTDGQRLPATYANFLIINGAVLVPTYAVPQDAEALVILQNIFPERTVVGIDCRPLILQHGSLHCVTMQYPAGVVG